MELIGGKVAYAISELNACGIELNTIYTGISRRKNGMGDTWQSVKIGGRRFVYYDSLKPVYKELVIENLCGGQEPSKFLQADRLNALLIAKPEDAQAIFNYQSSPGVYLPFDKIESYTEAAKYLAMLSGITLHTIKSLGYANASEFYSAVISKIKAAKLPLPCSYSRLLSLTRQYKVNGAPILIHGHHGKPSNNKKIKDEVCEALLLEMIGHYNQFDDTFIALQYNKGMTPKGYKAITRQLVGTYRRKHSLLITNSRNGSDVWKNKFSPSIKRKRSTAPLYLINSDDNVLDLFYHSKSSDYFRPTLIVVTDTFNNYPLGYAIGVDNSIELIKEAYRNAIHHIHELTGEWLLWNQFQTDNWGLSRRKANGGKEKQTVLGSWYDSIGSIFTPAQVGNARSKSIEQYFGNEFRRTLQLFPNWAGPNVNAKMKVNKDAIKRNKKDFPDISEAPKQIEMLFHQLRHQENEQTGLSRQQEWIAAHRKLLPEQKNYLTDEKRLLTFGVKHPYLNRITSSGINITINGEVLTYDMPQEQYIEHIGKTMQVYYNPYDPSHILATHNDATVRVVCPANVPISMALKDATEGERIALNTKLHFQKEVSRRVLDKEARRKDILNQHGWQASSILQAGVLNKEMKQLAEQNYFDEQIENGRAVSESGIVPPDNSTSHESIESQTRRQKGGEELDVFDLMLIRQWKDNPDSITM